MYYLFFKLFSSFICIFKILLFKPAVQNLSPPSGSESKRCRLPNFAIFIVTWMYYEPAPSLQYLANESLPLYCETVKGFLGCDWWIIPHRLRM